jgi:hypothetical protein
MARVVALLGFCAKVRPLGATNDFMVPSRRELTLAPGFHSAGECWIHLFLLRRPVGRGSRISAVSTCDRVCCVVSSESSTSFPTHPH